MTLAAEEIARAIEVLRTGGLVVFPTETVYGLGADASNPGALRRMYAVKARPAHHPVIVHLGDPDQLDEWGRDVPDDARLLAAACWPGPLTVVVRRNRAVVPDQVTGGLDTVGLRLPDQRGALRLLRAFGGGIAAPSANRFGRVSPTTAAHVRADLGDDVDMILDDGPCGVGVESTIVDCSGSDVAVLRPGAVTSERLSGLLGRRVVTRLDADGPRAPGRQATHYSPGARVVVIRHTGDVARAIERLGGGLRVGLLTLDPAPEGLPRGLARLAAPQGIDDFARVLYARFHEADDLGLDVLLVVEPPATGIGVAIGDRLRRAAAR